jgi:uncharacterized protein YdaU (DUF1376 family)
MGLQWYPKYPGDYARDTSHLTMLEHGAYTLLMDHYYSTGKPLPANEDANAPTLALTSNPRLYRICRATSKQEQDAVDYIISEFFVLEDGRYHQSRADREIEKRLEISDKRRAAREARDNKGPKKKGTKAPTNAGTKESTNADTTTTTTTTTELSLSKDKESSGRVPDSMLMSDGRFLSCDQYCQELWELYPSIGRGKGHKGKFFEQVKKHLKKGVDHEEIRAGIARYSEYCSTTGELNQDAFRWARDAGWQNDYTISAAAHRPQQGNRQDQAAGGLDKIIDTGEKAKEMLRRQASASGGEA